MKLAITAAAVLAIAAMAFLLHSRSAGAQAFPDKVIREYESLLLVGGAGTADWGPAPARRGKVVLVRPSSWQVYRLGTLFSSQILPGQEGNKELEIDPPRLDDAWYLLDPDVRASRPEEVETVIMCDYRKIPVREYLGIGDFSGPNASARKAVGLKVYDWKARRFLGECLLAEDHAELNKVSVGRFSGQASEVAAFVARM